MGKKKKNKKKKSKKPVVDQQIMVKKTETEIPSETSDSGAPPEKEEQEILSAAMAEQGQADEQLNEEADEQAGEQEDEEEEIERYETFESWGAPEHSPRSFKPIAVAALALFAVCIGAIGYLVYSDPANAWDRAEVANDIDTDNAALEPEIKTATAAPSLPKETVIAERSVVTPEPQLIEPSAEQAPQATQTEQPEPEAPTTAEPEVAEAAPASAEYTQLLEEAKKTRGMKKKIGAFRTVLEANPTGHEALAELAILLMDRKSTREEAFDMATRSSEINEDNAAAWLAIGYIHQLNGKAADARAAYKKCSKSTGPKSYVRECRQM